MKKNQKVKYGWVILLIIALIILDQTVKIIAEYKFNYIRNEISINQQMITAIITDIIVIAMVIRFMIVQRDKMYKITQISLSLILAGGIGNLIDKILKGGKINFIDISAVIPKFPTFNLADIFIIAGFIIFVITVAVNLFSLRKGEVEIQNEQTNNS